MSEQPFGQSTTPPTQEGTRFDDVVDARLDFHVASESAAPYDPEVLARRRREQEKPAEIDPVEAVGALLVQLDSVRVAAMRIEDKPFLNEDRAA